MEKPFDVSLLGMLMTITPRAETPDGCSGFDEGNDYAEMVFEKESCFLRLCDDLVQKLC
jgi:hypothetical protein